MAPPFRAEDLLRQMKTLPKGKIQWNGMCEPRTASEDEQSMSSEHDDDDLVPGPGNQATAQEEQLKMVHASLLVRKYNGKWKYVLDGDVDKFISPGSDLYACGGPVVRVQISRDYEMDVMICWKGRCTFCAKIFGPDETDAARNDAMEWEDTHPVNTSDSPYQGQPVVHWKDTKFSEPLEGFIFEPVKMVTMDDEVTIANGQILSGVDDMLFTDGDEQVGMPCLTCEADSCAVCINFRAGQRNPPTQEQNARAAERRRQKRQQERDERDNEHDDEHDDADDEANEIKVQVPKRIQQTMRPMGPRGGRKGSIKREASSDMLLRIVDDEENDEEAIWQASDGEVYRDYLRIGDSPAEQARRRGKGRARK